MSKKASGHFGKNENPSFREGRWGLSMLLKNKIKWHKEADIIVVGFGGAEGIGARLLQVTGT